VLCTQAEKVGVFLTRDKKTHLCGNLQKRIGASIWKKTKSSWIKGGGKKRGPSEHRKRKELVWGGGKRISLD